LHVVGVIMADTRKKVMTPERNLARANEPRENARRGASHDAIK
jgi:hypothetical protein